jgi:hypothetical protein
MADFKVQSMTTANPSGVFPDYPAPVIRTLQGFIAQTLAHDEPSQFATNSLTNGWRAMMARYRIGKN